MSTLTSPRPLPRHTQYFCPPIHIHIPFNVLSPKDNPLTHPITDRTTPTGQIINTYLTDPSTALCDQAIHLLFAANRWEAAPRLAALLASGTTVVCDRYYYSGMVYSVAKQNPALPPRWARAPEVGLPRPDLVVFLDLEGDVARARGGWGDERYERREVQERVRRLFWGLKEGTLDGEEAFEEERSDLAVVDAGGSVEEVADEIWKLVRARVDEVEAGKFGKEVRTVS